MHCRTLAPIALLLAGCAALTQDTLDARFGAADPRRFDRVPAPVAGSPTYRRDVKPILDRRCVVCHGCYDAPCQLKLGSWDGIARGSSKLSVYANRLLETPTTRLGLDAERPSQWRALGFEPVLNERTPRPDVELAASVLYRSLQHKQAHPLPATALLPDSFDFRLDRAQSCPTPAEYDAHQQRQPLAGMPYGLPGLSAAEHDTVRRWLLAGAPDDAPPPLPPAVAQQVAEWEGFLNGPSLRQQLMSRYLYEHLFLGHLHFDGDAAHHVFRLVRSATPPGTAVQVIATRRPFDAPGVARPYYRLVPETETLLAKTHMPFVLSAQRMARWRSWFLDGPSTVDRLPGYDVETAANPFRAFAALPLESRHRFLLDEAQFFVMNFIKGPVCRGQTALDVIDDRFWVFFMDPAVSADDTAAQLVSRAAQVLRLPASEGSLPGPLAWREMAASEDALLAAKQQAMARRFAGRRTADLSLVWQGDGRNANAALTVFRHFDSASVVRGLVGGPPKTAWLIGYPLLERIHYLLVAGYDVFGSTPHQLATRLYMDFLRMEGEANFLLLLPSAQREGLRDRWYRGADADAKARVHGSKYHVDVETGIAYQPGDAMPQLVQLLQQHLAPVLETRFDLQREPDAGLRQALQPLAAVRGAGLSWWPQVAFLRVDAPGRPARWFSLLRDTGHLNVSTLLHEADALAPDENALTVVPGFVGAYPNVILKATPAELPTLARDIAALRTEADYRRLADRHAVRRSDPGFWAVSDALHEAYQRWAPGEAGLFDYGRLENR